MASSLLRFTRSVLPFRQAAYHLPSIRQHSENTRSFSSPAVSFDLSYLRTQMEIMAGVPSISFTLVKGEELTVNVPGLEKTVTDESPCVTLHMPGVRKGGTQAVVVDDDKLLIHVQTDEEIYLAGMKLPENFDRNGCYKGVFAGEMLKLTLPLLKNTDETMRDFVDDTTVNITRPTPYCVMFDRSDLGWKFCELIAHPRVKSKSFTLYKDTCESIHMKRNMPGVEKLTVTRDGLHVSLSMPGLHIEDVESGFEYDALFIEGRRENEHYIAGIRVPEGFHRENHMIKREMQDGVFKATLPHVDIERRMFSVYRYR